MTGIVLLSIGIVAVAMLAMAVGVLFSRPCLRGSCTVVESIADQLGASTCEACPLRGHSGEPGTLVHWDSPVVSAERRDRDFEVTTTSARH